MKLLISLSVEGNPEVMDVEIDDPSGDVKVTRRRGSSASPMMAAADWAELVTKVTPILQRLGLTTGSNPRTRQEVQ